MASLVEILLVEVLYLLQLFKNINTSVKVLYSVVAILSLRTGIIITITIGLIVSARSGENHIALYSTKLWR